VRREEEAEVGERSELIMDARRPAALSGDRSGAVA
jgi:hypothetical protein